MGYHTDANKNRKTLGTKNAHVAFVFALIKAKCHNNVVIKNQNEKANKTFRAMFGPYTNALK